MRKVLKAVFEDESLLVVAKPPGQTVNRAETTQGEITLQDELEKYLGLSATPATLEGPAWRARAGIVHRLDKETSGILVVAKTPEAFEKLQAQFKLREVEKEYLTLVHGEIPREGRIEEPIGRLPKRRGHFGVVAGGRESTTEYQREAIYKREEEIYSFVRVHPKTGRTHQIRVHLKKISHPVVSDPLYLLGKRLREDLKFCPRMFLHAASLTFNHPASSARMRFEAELPSDLNQALTKLTPITTEY